MVTTATPVAEPALALLRKIRVDLVDLRVQTEDIDDRACELIDGITDLTTELRIVLEQVRQ
jgi:hypothetical protein